MTDKPKRKNQYHRWWAFRGLLIVLIAFLGAVGYFLTREPGGEYIIYQMSHNSMLTDGGAIKQVNIHTLESENLVSPDSENFSINDFVVSGNGHVLVYLEYERDFGMRAYATHIQTGERQFLFDCVVWLGNCYLEILNFDGSKLVFRVSTSATTWYELDILSGEMFALAETNDICGFSYVHQSLIVARICKDFPAVRVTDYRTGVATTIEQASNIVFANNSIQFAYTDILLDDYSLPFEREIYAGEWNDALSTRLIDTQRVNALEDWHPDNKRLLVSVYTEAYHADGGYEFILYDIETGEPTNLLYLRGVHVSQAQWNEFGTKFVYVATPMYGLAKSFSIWIYDTVSRETWRVAFDGMYPQWID